VSTGRSPVTAGLAATAHGKLILLLALATAALGLTAAMPLLSTFRSSLAGTLAGDHFIRNAATFAPTDFFDFLWEKGPAVRATLTAAQWAGLLGVVLQMFFAGGIVAVLNRGPFSFGQFLEPARRNFWHNLKCFLLFAVLCLLVLGLWFWGERALTKKLFEEVAPDSAVRLLAQRGSLVVELLLFAGLSVLYDFARSARRFSPRIGAWRGYRFAWRALSGSWWRGLGLWMLWFALGAAAVFGLFAIICSLHAVSRPAIALLALLQFGVLWLRSAVRVAAWGSYLEFLEPRAREALSAVARVTIASTASAPAPLPSA
jgi:hypothetical protein